MSPVDMNAKLELPCGVTLKNRLVKSAMTERISNRHFAPTAAHEQLYRAWAETGAGLLITGNVLVDRTHIESAGNICFDDREKLPQLRRWAEAGKVGGGQVWVQISHAGRQTSRLNTLHPLAPSAVQLQKLGLFGEPRPMKEADIRQVIDGFVRAAALAQEAGFDGVQIHAAHGYLLSQFLSPHTNRRTDQWGGSIENRSRLLLTILRETRKRVGADFPVSVKLNSADFQRGGFTEAESLAVVGMLDQEGIDLLEISGGTYEQLVFFTMHADQESVRESTKRREAYFIEFARKVRAISDLPLLVTGGFRSYAFCNEVLEKGELDLVGMARPFITNLADIPGFLRGEVPVLDNLVLRTGIKQLDDTAEGGYYAQQLIRLAHGKPVNLQPNPLLSANFLVLHEAKMALSKKFRPWWMLPVIFVFVLYQLRLSLRRKRG
jgi:2,4-dienoyl-CoA reductase-like NADH-dependent reductase (Old Yellow Enzyme family)